MAVELGSTFRTMRHVDVLTLHHMQVWRACQSEMKNTNELLHCTERDCHTFEYCARNNAIVQTLLLGTVAVGRLWWRRLKLDQWHVMDTVWGNGKRIIWRPARHVAVA